MARRGIVIVVVAMALLCLITSSILANNTVKGRKKIHQDKFPDFATDLHMKVWQKEDEIDIESWTVGVTGAATDRVNTARGSQPPPHNTRRETLDGSAGSADNGRHAVDIDIDFTTPPGVPHCNTVTVDVALELTSWNTLRWSGIEWTKQEQQKKKVADHGWAVAAPMSDPELPGMWLHNLCFCNDDLTDDLILKNLQAAVRPDPIALDDLELFEGWDVTLVDDSGMLIPAGTCVPFTILGPAGSVADSQHVWMHYEVWGAEPQDTTSYVDSWFDHYDFLDDSGYDPSSTEMSTWGKIKSFFTE